MAQRRILWRFTAVGTLGLALLCSCSLPRSGRIVVGAKNFTEQVVLGELLAQEIESVSAENGHPLKVERRFYLAGSYICQQALASGRIDAYVEYTGTALTAILKQPLPPPGQRDAANVFAEVSDLYAKRYRVKVERGLGFEDTFAMVVRQDDSGGSGCARISDAIKVAAASGSWASATSSSRGRTAWPGWSRPTG